MKIYHFLQYNFFNCLKKVGTYLSNRISAKRFVAKSEIYLLNIFGFFGVKISEDVRQMMY